MCKFCLQTFMLLFADKYKKIPVRMTGIYFNNLWFVNVCTTTFWSRTTALYSGWNGGAISHTDWPSVSVCQVCLCVR